MDRRRLLRTESVLQLLLVSGGSSRKEPMIGFNIDASQVFFQFFQFSTGLSGFPIALLPSRLFGGSLLGKGNAHCGQRWAGAFWQLDGGIAQRDLPQFEQLRRRRPFWVSQEQQRFLVFCSKKARLCSFALKKIDFCGCQYPVGPSNI